MTFQPSGCCVLNGDPYDLGGACVLKFWNVHGFGMRMDSSSCLSIRLYTGHSIPDSSNPGQFQDVLAFTTKAVSCCTETVYVQYLAYLER